jgi:GGDEF domain-containing protein
MAGHNPVNTYGGISMALSRFPTYLRLVGPAIAAERTGEAAKMIRVPAWDRDLLTGLASRQALLDRLVSFGSLAPTAPLSFVAARIDGADEMDEADYEELQRSIARKLRELSRPMDLAGRLADDTFGVVLQGTGATAAGAVSSRLAHHLNLLPELDGDMAIIVSAATGKGTNAETLAVAALDSFEQCAG